MTDRILTPLVFVVVACVADWALTVDAIAAGWAREGNPLMAPLLAASPAAAFLVKLGIAAACCTGLWVLRADPFARIATWLLAGIYAALLVYQVGWRFSL